MTERLYLAPDFETSLSSRGASVISFDEAWDKWRGDVVDENNLRDVERVEFSKFTAYLKRFHGIQTKNHWKLRWQRPRCHSQAAREVAIIHALQQDGFHPPRVLAWGQEVARGREVRSFLVTAEFDGRALSTMPVDSVRALLPDVAAELGRTVAAGVFLPDLGLDHVFALEGRAFGLLDFHNARRTTHPRRRELARALVRFFRSPGSDELVDSRDEFARTYLEAAGRLDALSKTERFFAQRLTT